MFYCWYDDVIDGEVKGYVMFMFISGANKVAVDVDLSGFSFKSFLLVQLKVSCR